MVFTLISFVFGPLLIISKIIQVFYPWMILIFLVSNGLLSDGKVDTFQLVMLLIYIGLQLCVLLLGIKVFRIHFWLYHLEPGKRRCNWYDLTEQGVSMNANNWYQEVCWIPKVEIILINRFGNDIGQIIMDYCRNFALIETK